MLSNSSTHNPSNSLGKRTMQNSFTVANEIVPLIPKHELQRNTFASPQTTSSIYSPINRNQQKTLTRTKNKNTSQSSTEGRRWWEEAYAPQSKSRAMISRVKHRSSTGTCSPKPEPNKTEQKQTLPTKPPKSRASLLFNRDTPPTPVLNHCVT